MSVQVPLGRSNENAADRIMRSLDNRITGEPKPRRKQVGMVLHALADHTATMSALKHRHDPTSPWPEATSMGRWFHDVGDMSGRQIWRQRMSNDELTELLVWAYKQGFLDAAQVLTESVKSLDDAKIRAQVSADLETLSNPVATQKLEAEGSE